MSSSNEQIQIPEVQRDPMSKEAFLFSLDNHIHKTILRVTKDKQIYNNSDKLIRDIQNFHQTAKAKLGALEKPNEFLDYEEKYQEHINDLLKSYH